MSYIKLAIVDENQDPKGIGRVRFKIMGESSSSRENAIKYNKWDNNDPFVALPFLPTNINFVPEVGQTVKIIYYDPDNDLLNREYIAGPFTTIHDFNSQTNSQQVENTSYGVLVKSSPDIFSDGQYKKKESVGSIAEFKDYAIYGPYGSDILFTENGINLRGGKFLVKDTLKKDDIQSFPIMSEKRAILSLKKFSTKKENVEFKTPVTTIPSKKLNYIIEYDVDDVTDPSILFWYVYEVKNVYGDTFNTRVFTSTTAQDLLSYSNSIKLINLDGTNVTPTHTESVRNVKDAYTTIRTTIDKINRKGLKVLNRRLPRPLLHPFYFRPVSTLTDKSFLKEVKPTTNPGSNNGSGLYYSPTENYPKPVTKEIIENQLVTVASNMEQTFGSLTSDKIYFLSSDTNQVAGKAVPFNKLNKYEYTQEELLTLIEPNTYSTVRGENLVKALILLYRVIRSHAHNPGEPMPDGTPNLSELQEVFKTIENDLLNKSIRIN